MKKGLLTLFIFICLTSTIYSGYLLFTEEINAITGSVLLSVGIIVIIWCCVLLRKHKMSISGNTMVAVIVIIAVLASTTGAYAGVEPLASVKDSITERFQSNNETQNQTILETNEKLKSDVKPQGKGDIVGKWYNPELPGQFIEFMKDGNIVIESDGIVITGDYELLGEDYIRMNFYGFAGGWASLFAQDAGRYVILGDTMVLTVAGKSETMKRIK